VYKFLFSEGVLYAKKDFEAPKHPEIDVPNLQVMSSPMLVSAMSAVSGMFYNCNLHAIGYSILATGCIIAHSNSSYFSQQSFAYLSHCLLGACRTESGMEAPCRVCFGPPDAKSSKIFK
jgi:hypothetical protein